MFKSISRLHHNISKNTTHFVFRNYVCIAVSGDYNNSVIGMSFADFMALHGIVFPDDASYMFVRTDLREYKIRESGAIINLYITVFTKMIDFKRFHLEVNCIPSQLNTSPATGVASQLASAAENAPQFDGVTIEQMRNNPLYSRGDKIDKIGLAQRKIADAAKVLTEPGRAKKIRALNDAARFVKPQNSKKYA